MPFTRSRVTVSVRNFSGDTPAQRVIFLPLLKVPIGTRAPAHCGATLRRSARRRDGEARRRPARSASQTTSWSASRCRSRRAPTRGCEGRHWNCSADRGRTEDDQPDCDRAGDGSSCGTPRQSTPPAVLAPDAAAPGSRCARAGLPAPSPRRPRSVRARPHAAARPGGRRAPGTPRSAPSSSHTTIRRQRSVRQRRQLGDFLARLSPSPR